jgi:hypothetical protein
MSPSLNISSRIDEMPPLTDISNHIDEIRPLTDISSHIDEIPPSIDISDISAASSVRLSDEADTSAIDDHFFQNEGMVACKYQTQLKTSW